MGTLNLSAYNIALPPIWGDVYIETGLSEGTSMDVACRFVNPPFVTLHGIEVDEAMVAKSRERFAKESRLTIYHGSSLDVLPKILEPSKRTIFWLDAHYDGAKPTSFDPRHGQCVLLEELRIIMTQPWRILPIILIDDASTFCSDEWWNRGAHGHGMDRAQNPTFQQLYDTIDVLNDRYIFLIKDQCIHCFPR